ncbi:PREDICTED: mediator of RNA polymerase II transcription subunit 11-like [Amphimedon queenslandica]|uniref:Mediator of RNA polymerase II transcription subunit 11 n=1 Tax=Amphimedon queenslandica TaxID=400682 RepID=A0A1X7VU52_AMPQE|nr:PREDICTED: mediator of RNA polymerase II transcription subunit 11-like [Amphimedon queenslandica]|eukprot:XP_003382781.1 PREDICTED: mediator of RNA polymerase II transcription subunit 11-like [Amphimedon queenslandica]
MSSTGVERIEKLQKIEQEIGMLLSHAADAIGELSKPNPAQEMVEYKTKDFLKSLETIEQDLSEQIVYLSRVSTTHTHEGSNYGAEKDFELLQLQTALAKKRLNH